MTIEKVQRFYKSDNAIVDYDKVFAIIFDGKTLIVNDSVKISYANSSEFLDGYSTYVGEDFRLGEINNA